MKKAKYLLFSLFIFIIPFNTLLSSPILEKNVHFFKWGQIPQSTEYKEIIPLYNNPSWEISVSDDEWHPISLPFYITETPSFKVKCTFNYKLAGSETDLFIISYGIKGIAQFYLNGTLIHYQPNNYAPIKIKLNRSMIQSRNELTIIIRNPLKVEEGFPTFVKQFTEKRALGITRPIFIAENKINGIELTKISLIHQNDTFLANYAYLLNFNTAIPKFKGKVTVEEEFSLEDGTTIFKRIFNIDTTSLKSMITGKINVAHNTLWSIDTPKTVILKVTLKKNYSQFFQSSKTFALRSFNYKNNNILLNGKPLIIKGINYHENLFRFKDVKFYQQIKKDLETIKKLGFNSIRLPHYFPGNYIVQISDSLGLLIFAELPVFRFPKQLFSNDNLLENSILTLNQLSDFFNTNPSFAAIGLGKEVPAHSPAVQKFMLILKGIISNKTNWLSYLSPIPNKPLPPEKLADLYVLDLYKPFTDFKFNSQPFALIGRLGILNPEIIYQWDSNISSQKHYTFLCQEVNTALKQKTLSGGFIESFADWTMEYKLSSTISKDQPDVFPSGIYSIGNKKKSWVDNLENIWELNSFSGFLKDTSSRSTNFFSILLFFSSIVFFSFVRRQYRLRENLKRAIYHPYGFFVDIRERRIIPIFNSVLMGIFTTFIIVSFIGAYIYYYHTSQWMQEILSVVFINKDYFNYYLLISASPLNTLLVISTILLLFPFFISLVLKFFSIFSRENFRYRQGVAISFWSAIPFLFMLPVSFFTYHLLEYDNFQIYLIYIFLIFLIWTQFRLINGIRVLFIVKTMKVFIWISLSYIVPIAIFWVLINPKHYWIEYLKLLFSANALF